ncbi:Hypothetical protein R9X50_00665000 [Acrodontium crateriforme]|uniref:Fungal N-terminal domain-containing protein n=1 Tax=Acrodontium crateriforme TaxID=150365 RepID=A0AAQ3MDF2_9PEZI|nr:Hypothetical protein R9X50_00665000 [Acrodontium crateriforme]
MDPISAIGAVGAVAGAINEIAELINKLRALYQAFKDADMNLISLISQLNTMKAALEQIELLMHHASSSAQLREDLGLALHACSLHIGVLDRKLSKLELKAGGAGLRWRSRVKVVFDSDEMRECLSRLDHQATALNLLISVLTSRTVTEQKSLLSRSQTRKVFRRIEEDSVSVLALGHDRDFTAEATRTKSEPVAGKSPWKRTLLNIQAKQSESSSGGIARFWRKKTSDGHLKTQACSELQQESEEDPAVTSPEPSEDISPTEPVDSPQATTDLPPPPPPYDSNPEGGPRFSRMLVFGHDESKVPDLVLQAQNLWSSKSTNETKTTWTHPLATGVFKLDTRYFEISIQYHSIHENRRISEEMLAGYKDVSSILFAVTLSNYCDEGHARLTADLELFSCVATDYHLWLAKIVLLLDTTGLEDTLRRNPAHDCFMGGYAGSVDAAVENIRGQFLQAGRMGAGDDRIHVYVGEPDVAAAGAVFAITNHANNMQMNKWSGLSRHPTA